MWFNTGMGVQPSIRVLASLGQSFYIAVAGTQLVLVMLAAPAATAAAIRLDRARGTLAHMLMTDLSNVEIVLGKLAARLVPVLTLVGCTLPMMEVLTLIGGIDPAALWGAFIVSVGVAVLGCSLALIFSLWVGKTHEALLATYAVWCLWLLAGPMIGLVSSTIGWSLPSPVRAADPFFLVLAPYLWPGQLTWSHYLWFITVAAAISVFLVALSILRVPNGVHSRIGSEAVAALERASSDRVPGGCWREVSVGQPVARPQSGTLARVASPSSFALGDWGHRDLRGPFAVLQHPHSRLGRASVIVRERSSGGSRPAFLECHGVDVAG